MRREECEVGKIDSIVVIVIAAGIVARLTEVLVVRIAEGNQVRQIYHAIGVQIGTLELHIRDAWRIREHHPCGDRRIKHPALNAVQRTPADTERAGRLRPPGRVRRSIHLVSGAAPAESPRGARARLPIDVGPRYAGNGNRRRIKDYDPYRAGAAPARHYGLKVPRRTVRDLQGCSGGGDAPRAEGQADRCMSNAGR